MAGKLEETGVVALSQVKDSEPEAWLAPPPELAHSARVASELLFKQSSAYATKCPLKTLFTNQFDAEQIWQQIDLQSAPLLASIRRRLRKVEKCEALFGEHEVSDPSNDQVDNKKSTKLRANDGDREKIEAGSSEKEDGFHDHERRDSGDAGPVNNDDDKYDSEIGDDDDDDSKEEEEDDDDVNGEESRERRQVEDKFFKLQDMEKFLDEAETPNGTGLGGLEGDDLSEDDEYADEDNDIQVDDEQVDSDADLNTEDEDIKYNDFFGEKGDAHSRKNEKKSMILETENLSTHEKQLTKIQKRIEQLETENLDSKFWTMQGEVSALKRPKNSALEVELDFEHNIRPPPVITEEVTASLEDLIRKRIAEDNFDDIQPKPSLTSSAPKEQIELDETKSQKGLAEIYEADYLQHTGLAPASLTPADKMRKEATQLFRALCVNLDALSHFHFTPKPVIEDMAVRTDVPALAMEEVAPLTVSDATMLAPEEVFSGDGVIKAEAELSREERKRRRARSKNQRKVEKKRKGIDSKTGVGTNLSSKSMKTSKVLKQSHFAKSSKVFGQLDQVKSRDKQPSAKIQDSHRDPSLKL